MVNSLFGIKVLIPVPVFQRSFFTLSAEVFCGRDCIDDDDPGVDFNNFVDFCFVDVSGI